MYAYAGTNIPHNTHLRLRIRENKLLIPENRRSGRLHILITRQSLYPACLPATFAGVVMCANPLTPAENQFLQSAAQIFKEMYDQHWEFLFRLACKKIGSADDAYDLVHDLFADLWRTINETPVDRSYLVSCLYHKIFNYFRSKGLREKHYKNLEAFLTHQAVTDPAWALVQEEKEKEIIHQAIEREITGMPEKMKKIFIRNHYHDQSIDQIAGDLALSKQTVKNQLHIASKRLRRAMKQFAMHFFSLL
jgi:RNA polymerase sigma factor (sigma-70 family)